MRETRTGKICQPVQPGHPSGGEVRAGRLAQDARGRLFSVLFEKDELLPRRRNKRPGRRSVVRRTSVVTPPVAAPVQRVRSVRTPATARRRRAPRDRFHRRRRLPDTGSAEPLLRSLRRQARTYIPLRLPN